MTRIAGTVSVPVFESLMNTHRGDLLHITLNDGRRLVGRSTGRLLQVQVTQMKFEVVRVSAYDVVAIDLV